MVRAAAPICGQLGGAGQAEQGRSGEEVEQQRQRQRKPPGPDERHGGDDEAGGGDDQGRVTADGGDHGGLALVGDGAAATAAGDAAA